jgi:hypothetical protein
MFGLAYRRRIRQRYFSSFYESFYESFGGFECTLVHLCCLLRVLHGIHKRNRVWV